MTKKELDKLTGLDVYEKSIVTAGGATYFLGRRGGEKLVGCIGPNKIKGSKVGQAMVGPPDHANASAIRAALPWTAPKCLGLTTSAGLGDRLGLATPGHIRAAGGKGLALILAQQSIREMTRTQRQPEQVMDCATWGVLQEGYNAGFGSDADHLQETEGIDATAAVGFTMFTIDPGKHVANEADTLPAGELATRYDAVDLKTLETKAGDFRGRYAGKKFSLAGGGELGFTDESFLRAAIKYGNAVAHTVKMYRHLLKVHPGKFELEVSVDETDSPTSPAEHYLFAAELKRLGVPWVSMAPRFVGRFEKGVDYIGDIEQFRKSFTSHAAVMRTLGPYKISIHSGSDKFSIYPIVAEATAGCVHLKTAGTSYLEALRAVAVVDPKLYREIYEFARGRYDTDKASYHVSADIAKVPPASSIKDEQLAATLDHFDTRQALHVTFGSVLTADGGKKFRDGIYAALTKDEEAHYAALVRHLGKHVAPFAAVVAKNK